MYFEDQYSQNKLEEFVNDFSIKSKGGINTSAKKVGAEIELLPFCIEDSNKIPIPAELCDKTSGNCICDIIDRHFEKKYGTGYKKIVTDEIRFEIKELCEISFEPAGQLEISTIPYGTLNELIINVKSILNELDNIFRNNNIVLVAHGCNPWHSVTQLGLRNKKERYLVMQDYFNSIGPYGIKMMRQTASVQVNLDLGNEDIFPLRWDAINLLSPVFIAIFANSRVIDNEISDFMSIRNYIWQNTDKSRTGFPQAYIDETYKDNPIKQYIEFAFDANVMFYNDGIQTIRVSDSISFRNWLNDGINGKFPSLNDWNVHLSTLFPNVRLRKNFEIRYIDCPLRKWMFVPVILMTAIIYDDAMLKWTIEYLGKYRTKLDMMCALAAEHGLKNIEINTISKTIFKKALDSVYKLPESYLGNKYKKTVEDFYLTYTDDSACQADEYQQILDRGIFSENLLCANY